MFISLCGSRDGCRSERWSGDRRSLIANTQSVLGQFVSDLLENGAVLAMMSSFLVGCVVADHAPLTPLLGCRVPAGDVIVKGARRHDVIGVCFLA